LRSCYVLQDHNDDERDKIVFYKITPDLQDQDQDHSVKEQDQDRIFLSQTGHILRRTFSDHITDKHIRALEQGTKRRKFHEAWTVEPLLTD